jgi:hypothetical protein
MTRVHIGILVAVLGAVAGLGQGVGLYTDWLWFREVGYTGVFVTILVTRAVLVVAAMVVVFTVLYVNARLAARRAAPDVLWELDNQLRLPAYGAIQAATGRALPLVLAALALVIGLGAAGSWPVVLGWLHQGPFGATDPLFDRDIGFFVFGLPFWRLLVSWATGLLVGALLVTVLMYVLRGSVVLTERGLRVGLTARNHLLVLAGLFLLVRRPTSGWTVTSSSTRAAAPWSAPPTRTCTPRSPSWASSRCSRWPRPRRVWCRRASCGCARRPSRSALSCSPGGSGSGSIRVCCSGSASPPTSLPRSGRSSSITSG